MTAVILGLILIIGGAWGLLIWPQDFIQVVRGFLPISLFVGGLVAFVSGIASLRVSRSNAGKD